MRILKLISTKLWLIIPFMISLAVVLVQSSETAVLFLQFDKEMIRAGEIWRLITGHLVHWSWDHLSWDLFAFMILGPASYRHNSFSFWFIMLAGPVLISGILWVLLPGMVHYRGLSAIAIALFAYVAAAYIVEAFRVKSYGFAATGLIMFFALAAKMIFELVTGTTVFVSSGEFISLPRAHLAGAALGLVTALIIDVFFPNNK
ncbi:MAG: rhombosortase [bacterium]|nr:rhombosortase [bacterium]